ncbi:hypothetical protein M438DRAFT_378920 [Aureobasidium pullulans EXF-150]|uniref:Gfo/Idh/MocA-like oxidoreductase N-terminal domain-containing protein n=1 Tax=Aureobasidium pullulans EXF-150 TaxID=1043002 RepID=A0A074X8M4_AURPU|nr:uncharacterized protein M438DRAFT_378920 [Aureobasidium pullulans EXF-150]KEQ78402.1 hypothetical protein M438DRAFT_378920 [Aureobasidium pullulans EXF-150]
MIVGIGPHAQRTYIPQLQALGKDHGEMVKAGVDVEEKRIQVTEWALKHCPKMKTHFVPFFTDVMPAHVKTALDHLVDTLEINALVVSTEPLAHKAYALWAMGRGLSILMDKPITTRERATVDINEARGIAEDYHKLFAEYSALQKHTRTCFMVSSHRRFNPIFKRAMSYIREIAEHTGCPVTGISASYCDGTFRLPLETLEQRYHTYSKGYGKVSHSGYHILDLTCCFAKAGIIPKKSPDSIDVISSFISPKGFFRQLREEDYQNLFGVAEYQSVCTESEQDLAQRAQGYGEIDAVAQLTFRQEGDPVMLAQLNISSTGYGQRSTLHPNPDQYKGNGRVKHEAYEIRSGPFQTIYIESRSIADDGSACTPGNFQTGANNHFEMQVFRNHELTGHAQPMEVLHLADLADELGYSHEKLYTEQAKSTMILEMILFIEGKIDYPELTSNLDDHRLPAEIMSAMYVSHILDKKVGNPVATISLP